jgi:hypothetical protein
MLLLLALLKPDFEGKIPDCLTHSPCAQHFKRLLRGKGDSFKLNTVTKTMFNYIPMSITNQVIKYIMEILVRPYS